MFVGPNVSPGCSQPLSCGSGKFLFRAALIQQSLTWAFPVSLEARPVFQEGLVPGSEHTSMDCVRAAAPAHPCGLGLSGGPGAALDTPAGVGVQGRRRRELDQAGGNHILLLLPRLGLPSHHFFFPEDFYGS